MRSFYILAPDPGRDDLQSVTDYELGGLALSDLWKGKRLEGEFPGGFRLMLSDKNPSDLLGNPLSLSIMSDRTLSIVRDFVAADLIQVFNPPMLNVHTKELVTGYNLVNCVKSVQALSPECAKGRMIVDQLVVKEKLVPPEVNLFRLAERPIFLAISEELFRGLSRKGLQGLVAIRMKSET
jgi:hypothetical protein